MGSLKFWKSFAIEKKRIMEIPISGIRASCKEGLRMFYMRIPRYMTTPPIRLRPARVWDGPFLREVFKREDFLLANNLKKPIYSSWLLVWWWIKRTFLCTYCILVDSRRIGFIGLYNLKFRKSIEISLFIFEKHMRHLGYGSKALNLLAQNLKRFSFVDEIIARVGLDNCVALSFCQKNGFKELYTEDHIITMSINLLDECGQRTRIREIRRRP
jgi:GNAT superfamily N-acetyltransferase